MGEGELEAEGLRGVDGVCVEDLQVELPGVEIRGGDERYTRGQRAFFEFEQFLQRVRRAESWIGLESSLFAGACRRTWRATCPGRRVTVGGLRMGRLGIYSAELWFWAGRGRGGVAGVERRGCCGGTANEEVVDGQVGRI